ncbi:MAG: ParB/RepB/Spo0J family partition protein [Phycisphaerae bacterium]|nr:ParB/RepB/Spo0J family partition protein [Phycisphaerales bacterium]
MAKKPNRLGRGLNSLISSSLLKEADDSAALAKETPSHKIDITPDPPASSTTSIVGRLAELDEKHQAESANRQRELKPGETLVLQVSVSAIVPNAHQPRRTFDPVSISRLARSVTESGILQPLLVRAISDESTSSPAAEYELIAGERRLRAAKAAGIETVPVILKAIDSKTSMELALVENIQREDLNAIDRARAYRAYCDRTGYSAEEASRRLGEDRSTVANYLRLLDLAEPVAKMVESGQLSMGHARALLGAESTDAQIDLAKQVASQGLSVRAVESLVKSHKAGKPTSERQSPAPTSKTSHLADIQEKLQQAAKTKVTIKPGKGAHRGKIVIDYYSLDDFDRIAAMLGYTASDAH